MVTRFLVSIFGDQYLEPTQQILCRIWVLRRWIIQKVALSPNTVVHCGTLWFLQDWLGHVLGRPGDPAQSSLQSSSFQPKGAQLTQRGESSLWYIYITSQGSKQNSII
jgi:hypothetical protein